MTTPEDNNPVVQPQQNVLVEQTIEERVKELNTALEVVKQMFVDSGKNIYDRLILWVVLCFALLFFIIMFYNKLFNIVFPENWTWQIGYSTAIRISAIGALFSILAFIIKMIRSYLHLYEHNKHKQVIVSSMSNFVGAATSKEQRELIYFKLIEMVVQMENTGMINKESENKEVISVKELLQALTKKKE
jgi:hypothetical protein